MRKKYKFLYNLTSKYTHNQSLSNSSKFKPLFVLKQKEKIQSLSITIHEITTYIPKSFMKGEHKFMKGAEQDALQMKWLAIMTYHKE